MTRKTTSTVSYSVQPTLEKPGGSLSCSRLALCETYTVFKTLRFAFPTRARLLFVPFDRLAQIHIFTCCEGNTLRTSSPSPSSESEGEGGRGTDADEDEDEE